MKINRKNYELFFVDYLDGKLSHSDQLELMAFLSVNPDLEEELNMVRDIKIEPENISFSAKNSLKKNEATEISIEKFQELCVSKIEKTISSSDEALLTAHLQKHPELIKDLQLFELTLLRPDLSVTAPNKENLKQLSSERIEELIIGKIEKTLNAEEKSVLTAQINKQHELEKEIQLFEKTILKADLSIVYPDKNSLKRRTLGVSYRKIVIRSLSAAASVAILFVLYTTLFNQNRFGQSPKSFATMLNPFGIKNNSVNSNNTNSLKKTFANTQHNNIIIKNHTPQLMNDTSVSIAQNQTNINPDTNRLWIAQNNTTGVDTASHINPSKNNPAISNENFNKTYDAIFAETKYSHFKDMIENVPFQAIQPYSSGLANIGIWDVVEAGSKGFSAVTGANVNFQQKTDKKRKTEKYSFHIGRFGFSRTIHK